MRKPQETLIALQLSRRVLRPGEARPIRQRAKLLFAVFVAASVSSTAFAQHEVIRCLPPDVPITDLPEAVLLEYRTEIATEFEAYFTAVSDHIACLDAERSRALLEAASATEDYSTFLNTPTAQKDLP